MGHQRGCCLERQGPYEDPGSAIGGDLGSWGHLIDHGLGRDFHQQRNCGFPGESVRRTARKKDEAGQGKET
jgi:hypothetical protein